jgi:hypothetical protein
LKNKGGMFSFGTIVAVFGSILIALGFAWLIAQNWHQMPAALKISILLTTTVVAYIVGIILRMHEYEGIGKSLLVLGALLYTLSIFLIAQIFSTGTTPQGVAWLLFLSWIGVLAASLIFESGASLIIVVVEFFIWTLYQFWAFVEACSRNRVSEFGCYILSSSFLITGILLSLAVSLAIYFYFRNSKKAKSVMDYCVTLISSTLILFIILLLIRPGSIQSSAYTMFSISFVAIILSYIFRSRSSVFIALSEFTVAIILQYFAFSSHGGFEIIKPGMLVFYLLAIGIIFYGISLIHRAADHIFGKTYQWWTAFYFLLFTYILSFQTILPLFWTRSAILSTPSILFLVFIGILALVSLIYGVIVSIAEQTARTKEIAGFLSIAIVLIILIASTSLTSDVVGSCRFKTCSQYRDQNACENTPEELNCGWYGSYCNIKNCNFYDDENSCINSDAKQNCHWDGKSCMTQRCYSYINESSCNEAGCSWVNNYCSQKSCRLYRDQASCDDAPTSLDCKWRNSYCDEARLCEEYNNDANNCLEQNTCTWDPSNYGLLFGGKGQVPITLLAVWIAINFAFILIILAVIGYGTWQKSAAIVNLGIIFFVLDIVTRYIGFIIDYWGYTSLSIIFISGGVLLLVGGWSIEKWRRSLIQKVKSSARDSLDRRYRPLRR